jgi:predicted nucleotidyltransferase
MTIHMMEASRQYSSLRSRLESFCRSHGIEALYVFGSRAAEICGSMAADRLGTEQSSDVDIAVRLTGGRLPSIRGKAELAVALENLMGADRVDLVLLAEADPFLAVNVIRGERLFCRDAYAADEYELYVLRRAGDLARFERLRIERVLDPPQRK